MKPFRFHGSLESIIRWQALGLFCVALATPSLSQAQADIYRCEGEAGIPLYQNVPGKGCRKLDIQPLTTIPAPKAVPAARAVNVSSNGAGAPGSFPRVDHSVQRERDLDKRRILEEELKKEESRLIDLRKDYNNGEPERFASERNYETYRTRVQKMREDIGRAEANIQSLRRELGMVRS